VLYHCHGGWTQDEVAQALSHVGVWGSSNSSLRPLISPLQRQNAKRKAHAPARQPQRERVPEHILGKIVAVYDYVDERGELLYQVVRMEPKSFRQRRPDGKDGWKWSLKYTTAGRELAIRPVLYRLPEVLAAEIVFIVEGEKDADTLRDMGFVATSISGGARSWRPGFNEFFRGKEVYIIPDRDYSGL